MPIMHLTDAPFTKLMHAIPHATAVRGCTHASHALVATAARLGFEASIAESCHSTGTNPGDRHAYKRPRMALPPPSSTRTCTHHGGQMHMQAHNPHAGLADMELEAEAAL